ncbi:MAG TPA: adenylate/guanylate cyclase domain-containing protein [Herpetosiphonaceae bacterium]
MERAPRDHTFKRRLSLKITAPYLFLSLVVGLAAIYLVAQMEAQALSDAFSRQLNDGGQRVSDSVVRQEEQQLAAVRAIANLAGLGGALRGGDGPPIADLVFPYVVNQQLERVAVLDMQGRPLWAAQRTGPGAADYGFEPGAGQAAWPFVAAVLQGRSDEGGDKFIGLGDEGGGWVLYTVGPVFDGSAQAGAVLVGTPLSRLTQLWREAALADVTIYDAAGQPLATSLGAERIEPIDPAAIDGASAPIRTLTLGSRSYGEVLGPLRVRQGEVLGRLGVALPTAGAEARGNQAAGSLLGLFGVGSVAIILTGFWLTRRIVRPINALVGVSEAVSAGDLSRQLPVLSNDELGELTHTYNSMVAGLRERERVQDILRRFVSPTVANLVLQRPLDFTGELRLLSILFTDIRNFTAMSEELAPDEVVRSLNEYFTVVVRAAERHGGLVNKFGGDSTLVLFGLDEDDPAGRSGAQAALAAALAIRAGMAELNQRRAADGQAALHTGIGINTGEAVAGLIGAEQRMEYTVIGDAVNLSARIQALSRELGGDILISANTYQALDAAPGSLPPVEDLGEHQIKGKQNKVRIYSVAEEAVHA